MRSTGHALRLAALFAVPAMLSAQSTSGGPPARPAAPPATRPAAAATQSSATESRVVYFRLAEVVSGGTAGDSMIVRLAAGEDEGVVLHGKGEVRATWSKVDSLRKDGLGTAEVIAVAPTTATAIVRVTDSRWRPRAGDMVAVPARVPRRAKRTILWDLVELGITFNDLERRPLVSRATIFFADGDSLLAAVLKHMASDVHATADVIRPSVQKDYPTLLEPRTAGRNRGVSVFQSMERATPADVEAFLRFVRAFPGKYMGTEWKVNETYATWVLNDAPAGHDEIRDTLMATRSDAEVAAVVGRYRKDIAGGGEFITHWNNVAEEWATEGKAADANRLNAISMRVAELLGDVAQQGWTVFSLAQIRDSEAKYQESFDIYTRALATFERVSDVRGQAYAVNNMAREMNQLSRYAEAVTFWRRSWLLKTGMTPQQAASVSDLRESIASTLTGLGNSYEKLSQYDSALAVFQRAIDQNATANSTKALRNRALLLKSIARVSGKQGNSDRAIQRLEESIALYRSLADRAGEADVLDEIGYQLTRQSKYKDAIARYEEAFAIYTALDAKRDAGFTRSRVGQAWWSLGDYQKAIDAHKAAIDLRTAANDRAGLAYSWSKLGALYRTSGDPTSAIDAYGKATGYYDAIGDRSGVAQTSNDVGAMYVGQEDYTHALEQYTRALAARNDIGAKSDIAQTEYDIGDVYQFMKNYPLAAAFYSRSLATRRAIGDKEGQASSLAELGRVANIARHDQVAAEGYFREALGLAVETRNRSLEAWTHGILGFIFQERGQMAQARQELERSLAIYREAGERAGESDRLIDLGELRVSAGAFDSAMTFYRQALTIATTSNSRKQVANAHNAIGLLHRQLGEFDLALKEANQSLELSQQVNNPWGIANAYMAIGSVYNARGEYVRAAAQYTRADSIYKVKGGALSRLGPINDRGTISFYQGEYDAALTQFREALGLLESAADSSENYAIVVGNIGEVLYEQRKYDEALTWLDRALALDARLGAARNAAAVLTIRGKLHVERQRYDLAQRDLDSAYTMSGRSGAREPHVESAGVLGKLYFLQKRFPDATRYLDEAVGAARTMGSDKLAWEPLYTRALVARAQGDTTRAIALLEEGVTVIEALRARLVGGDAAQRTFASGDAKAHVYDALISLLIPRNPERALGYVERSSNEELRSRFGGAKITYADTTRTKTLAAARDLQTRTEALRGQITATYKAGDTTSTAGQRVSLRKNLVIAENEYRGFVDKVVRGQSNLKNHIADAAREFRGAKASLPPDAAILAYMPGEERLFIFAATHDTVVAASVEIGRAELERRVLELVRAARRAPSGTARSNRGVGDDDGPPVGDVHSLAAALDSILVMPLASQLTGKTRLAIMPSGVLFYLPFEVLGQPAADGRFRFRAEERTIFYINNSERVKTGAVAMARPRIMAFGNADSTLMSAEREVQAIKTLYPDTRVYVRREATKARASAVPAIYNVVHFATHGMLDTAFATSYLKLAGAGPSDNGRLTANDIFALPGSGRSMVVLSACNTAVTDQSVADWPNSLALAFMDIGVRTVVASLWPVDDEATAILMNAFYREIPKVGRAEALRRAQMELIRNPKYNHPYYWGAFVLLGDWK